MRGETYKLVNSMFLMEVLVRSRVYGRMLEIGSLG